MNRLLTRQIPQQLYRPDQVRDYEARAAEIAGISMWQLMQRAGRAAFECLREAYPAPLRVAVLCGSGNNGGDGYVLATQAALAGYDVRVFTAKPAATELSARAQSSWQAQGGQIEALLDWGDCDPDVVVDALLGTGVDTPVQGDIAEAIASVNEARLPVIAIDVPSGLHADTGRVLGQAIQARHTVTMVAPKRGLYTAQAGDYCGQLWFADLGILREFRTLCKAAAWRLDPTQLTQAFPPRPWNCHKGMFGHVVIIGGSEGMVGAVQLAGMAALRAGAGKVTVICQHGSQGFAPELMVRSLQADDPDSDTLLQQADVIAIGPGLGQQQWGQAWWHKVVELDTPLVVDADALNLLARNPMRRDDWILTPHPGEASRLLATQANELEQDRWDTAARLHEQYGGVVVLKGAGSIIYHSDYVAVNTSGNPGLASAGMGDVLTGVIAAVLAPLYAQAGQLRQSLPESTGYAALVHGLAAQTASQTRGQRGLLASDVIDSISAWVNPSQGGSTAD